MPSSPSASYLPPTDEYLRPGFGLPLDYVPDGENANLFPNALEEREPTHESTAGIAWLPLTSLREFEMLQFMNQVTDKTDWHKKVFKKSITSKWKAKALADSDMTHKMVDWCLSELQFKAGIFEKTGVISVYNGDVVKSDTAIPESLKESLKTAVAPLEDVPEREKDWHPESDNLVLDLVHPSLFPLVYGRTRILKDSSVGLDDCITRSGEGVWVQPKAPASKSAYTYIKRAPFSHKFQWLPCDVDISGGEGHVKIKSYINNLHPQKHRPLYHVLEEIISRTIPLWNMTLTYLQNLDSPPIQRINYSESELLMNSPTSFEGEEPRREEDEDSDDFADRHEEWRLENSFVVQPEPEVFSSTTFAEKLQALEPVDLWKDYADRGLQIIVKLANIHLTPDKPDYDGGSWHVEGQLNERICASAIYYYDSDNITTSRLAFRQQSSLDQASAVGSEQDRHEWLEQVFGCENERAAIQDVGTIDTRAGRLIAWPNILEHQVQPFRLVDRTQPGHRKILAMFLVDPHIRIISTANVPCQRRDWWSEAITQNQSVISSLPPELQKHVFDSVDDFPIGLEKAKELRLELMEERKVFVSLQNEAFQQHQFALCEH